MKQLSQKEFEKCPKWLKKPKTFHSKLETLRYETIPITFHLNFVGEKLFIILSVSVLSVSVSADMKIIISVFYRYRPIWKKAYRSYTVDTSDNTGFSTQKLHFVILFSNLLQKKFFWGWFGGRLRPFCHLKVCLKRFKGVQRGLKCSNDLKWPLYWSDTWF